MESQTLGKVKMTPRGEYREETTYVPLDIVSYGGGSYCVLKNVTGVTPTGDDVNYQLLAESGADGKSPQIGASKTWLVWDADAGEYVDTGVSAAGEKGDDGDPGKAPIIGENGNWYEWDETAGAYTDTGKPSRGEKGNTGAEGADGADGRDGMTPTIGENGNWYLGETDTGKPSRGETGPAGADGRDGANGQPGADGKSAYQYAQDGGYTGTEAEFAAKLAQEMPDKLPNPNALTFTGAVTGSYDGSEAVSVEIPSGGGGSSAEPGYKDSMTLLDVTLDDETGDLKSYEYDVSGIEKTDVIIINILFPENYTGAIYVNDQNNAKLAAGYPSSAKGIFIGLKSMNGRYMHSCVNSGNTAARLEAPLSLFYGQLNGASGFERPKAQDVITKIKFVLTSAFVSGTRIRIYRW